MANNNHTTPPYLAKARKVLGESISANIADNENKIKINNNNNNNDKKVAFADIGNIAEINKKYYSKQSLEQIAEAAEIEANRRVTMCDTFCNCIKRCFRNKIDDTRI